VCRYSNNSFNKAPEDLLAQKRPIDLLPGDKEFPSAKKPKHEEADPRTIHQKTSKNHRLKKSTAGFALSAHMA
jgi:hypothetical protein